MPTDPESLLEALLSLQQEVNETVSALTGAGGDRQQRDSALLRAARLVWTQATAGPIPIGPGPGAGGSSTPVKTTCPQCGHSLTLTSP